MARVTKADLLRSQADAQTRAAQMVWLVRALSPKAGFMFVESPRGHGSYVVFIDEDGTPQATYQSAIGSTERAARNAELFRMYEDTHHLASLVEALQDEASSISRHR